MKYFVLTLFFLLISCSGMRENCKIKPDLERIGESVLENKENLKEIELRAAQARCNF